MKDPISKEQFLIRQPAYPQTTLTDPYYYGVANRLARIIRNESLLKGWDSALSDRVALGLTGYLQDILTDSGVWRSFIESCNVLYGRWLPFYGLSDNYIPHELNPEDVRFIVWYTLSMNSMDDRRLTDPMDSQIAAAAERLHEELDRIYEDPRAPMPEDYHISKGLELNNPAEADDVFHFGNWLFMHCYLMTPAYALSLAEMMDSPGLREDKSMEKLRKSLEESMMEDPTGPLAFYLREWLFLIIEGKMPPAPRNRVQDEPDDKEHPYYTKFMAATRGNPIRFFHTYDELNRFFIEALGWDQGENLSQLKPYSDFVLLVNRTKGMLAARDVAKCICLPDNPCYDKAYARSHAIDLLTVRGLCPGDLLQYVLERKALPDAAFPGSDDSALVEANADFIARCYLQKYYRGD